MVIQSSCFSYFGDVFERLLLKASRILLLNLHSQHLVLDALYTIIAETEVTLNRRSSTHVRIHLKDDYVLMPNHSFLDPALIFQRVFWNLTAGSQLSRAKKPQTLMEHFWKRLNREYKNTAQLSIPEASGPTSNGIWKKRTLSESWRIHTAPGIWSLRNLVKRYPGYDGWVRVCDVKTAVLCPTVKPSPFFRELRTWANLEGRSILMTHQSLKTRISIDFS